MCFCECMCVCVFAASLYLTTYLYFIVFSDRLQSMDRSLPCYHENKLYVPSKHFEKVNLINAISSWNLTNTKYQNISESWLSKTGTKRNSYHADWSRQWWLCVLSFSTPYGLKQVLKSAYFFNHYTERHLSYKFHFFLSWIGKVVILFAWGYDIDTIPYTISILFSSKILADEEPERVTRMAWKVA